jgi:hypothetical protein
MVETESRSWAFRKDKRTDEEAKRDLLIGDYKENLLMPFIRRNLELQSERKGLNVNVYYDYLNPDRCKIDLNGNAAFQKQDFILHFDRVDKGTKSECKVEIKRLENWYKKFTIKVTSLESCLKDKASIYVPFKYGYYIFEEKSLLFLKKNVEPTKSGNFGGKMGYKMWVDKIPDLVNMDVIRLKKWEPEIYKELEKSQLLYKDWPIPEDLQKILTENGL